MGCHPIQYCSLELNAVNRKKNENICYNRDRDLDRDNEQLMLTANRAQKNKTDNRFLYSALVGSLFSLGNLEQG